MDVLFVSRGRSIWTILYILIVILAGIFALLKLKMVLLPKKGKKYLKKNKFA